MTAKGGGGNDFFNNYPNFRKPQPQAGHSLLLSPPGGLFVDPGESALLVPAAQVELPSEATGHGQDDERDNFVGDQATTNQEAAAGAKTSDAIPMFRPSVFHHQQATGDVASHYNVQIGAAPSLIAAGHVSTSTQDSVSLSAPSPPPLSPVAAATITPPFNVVGHPNSSNPPLSNPYRATSTHKRPLYGSQAPPTMQSGSGGAGAALSASSTQMPPAVSSSVPTSGSPVTSTWSSPGMIPPPGVLTTIDPIVYRPVQPHWFYCKEIETKQVWIPFSLLDSVHLEEEYTKSDNSDNVVVVATDGGRYDVYLHDRVRCAVYWEEEPTPVRRATWFYRTEGERNFVPYMEHFAEKLEEEYCIAVNTNTWHRRLEFPEGETFVIHNPNVIVHYQPTKPDDSEGIPEGQMRPRVVKRGMDDYENVDDGEISQIDHLVFVVHGIGAFCDLKFRTLPEVVNDFRNISTSLLKTNFRKHVEEGRIGRVEFLPASWHTFLHGEATGIDEKLKPITLKSIPKLRFLANDAILDVLFYTSPVYCQAIISQVGSEINRLYALFLSRNPTFQGKVSMAGHSLGSVILFDLLLHQEEMPPSKSVSSTSIERAESEERQLRRSLSPLEQSGKDLSPLLKEATPPPTLQTEPENNEMKELAKTVESLEEALTHLGLEEYIPAFEKEKIDLDTILLCNENDFRDMGVPLGLRRKVLAFMKAKQNEIYKRESDDKLSEIPKIEQTVTEFTARPARSRRQSETTINYVIGLAGTGHPYVSYPRLNFQPNCFFALGSPIAMFLTVRGLDVVWDDFRLPTCPAFFNIFHPYDPVAYRIEPLLDPNFNVRPLLIPHHKGRKRMHLEIKESLSRIGSDVKQKLLESLRITWSSIQEFARSHRGSSAHLLQDEVDKIVEEHMAGQEAAVAAANFDDDTQSTISAHESREEDIIIGQLNGGRRIDYVLQEKPIESFNEYLFALGSHTCYWESEDTVLLILKEIYAPYGIHPSSQYPDPPPRPHPNFPQQSKPSHFSQGGAPTSKTNVPSAPWLQQQPQPSSPMTPTQSQVPFFSSPNPMTQTGVRQQQQSTFPGPGFVPTGLNSPPGGARMGMDPTAPISSVQNIGPPPMSGFVRQSVVKK